MRLEELAVAAIILVTVGIVASVGADILTTIQADQTANSYAYNITGKALEALEKIGNWLPTVGLVVAAVVVIGLVVRYFQRVM